MVTKIPEHIIAHPISQQYQSSLSRTEKKGGEKNDEKETQEWLFRCKKKILICLYIESLDGGTCVACCFYEKTMSHVTELPMS